MPLIANRNLKKKLLQLYPVKFLKDYFSEAGNREEILEIISDKPNNIIASFVADYHGVTKQNIYLFTMARPFNPASDMNGFPFDIGVSRTDNTKYVYLIFPKVVYSVYLNNPVAREDIEFLQPVLIEIEGNSLIVKFTKLEKNVKSYFPDDREPRLANETNTEDQTLSSIVGYFNSLSVVSVNDFNAGIKALWDLDDLDCMKISYRDAHSTVIVTMDGDLTFKQQYPDKYLEMANDPIGASSWKFLQNTGTLLEMFKCDPSNGIFNINKYSDTVNQTSNVISRILAQN